MSNEYNSKPVSRRDLPHQLSEETKNRLEICINRYRGDTQEKLRKSGKVTKSMCALIHEMKEAGVKVEEIKDQLSIESNNTIYYHLRDECSHEKRKLVTYDECGWMRVHAQKGAPSKTLSVLYNIRQENVTRHVTGKCSHGDGIQPVDPEKLRANSYTGPDMVRSICPECGDEFTHPHYKDQRFCSTQCNAEYASKKAHGVK